MSIRTGIADGRQLYSPAGLAEFSRVPSPEANRPAGPSGLSQTAKRGRRRPVVKLPRLLGAVALFCTLLATVAAAQTLDARKLSGGTADWDAASDESTILEFRIHAKNLMFRDGFAELDRIADEARSQKARFIGGQWKLEVFYSMLSSPGPVPASVPDSTWESYIARIHRWIAANPASITARMVLAKVYVEYAWKARGNGYSNTVTPEGRKAFNARIAQAKTVLDDAAKLPAKCPQYYLTSLLVAMAQEWSRPRVDALLEEAVAFEPGYFYDYVTYFNYLLPKWYGDDGEALAFADGLADELDSPQGDFVYFIMAATYAVNPLGRFTDVPLPAMSWDRIKQGFAATAELYGVNSNQLNLFAYMALQVNDTKAAQQVFGVIGDNYDQTVWGSKAAFDKAKASVQSPAREAR